MEYKVEEIYFKSSDGKNNVYAKILSPIDERKIKGVVEFCHGMCEYFDKYMEFYKFLIDNDYAVCGLDFLGHGKTVFHDSDLGFFGEKDGYKFFAEDVKILTDLVKKRFPYNKFFLVGHSMGSLIARNFAAKYGKEISGLILCGTVGPLPIIEPALKLTDVIISRKGHRYRSRVLDKAMFDFANLTFKPVTIKNEWTTRDLKEAEKSFKDSKQNFIFTACGFKDLFKLVKLANSDKVIKTVPKDLPIFFFSGSEDPVGEKTLGVKRAIKLYKDAKIKNISSKFYKGARHECLRETNREEVFKDVLDFLDLVRFGEE